MGPGLAVAAKTGSAELLTSVREAFMTSFGTTMWVSAGIGVAGAVPAAALMPKRAAKPSEVAPIGISSNT
ncbi:hypothetical protein F1D05_05505 [Kribbella qitaiheensis]|uniref:Uncharacterized protein n=1 Tax=Kribbella qitaiheensis TaxID=1544730 RepID=A0A7G6WU01_9ACTN|nr:hypothetical protein [Kribbella qitaiheensis]QNE17466.1 hypothetical protein F1D05_05505 [Kribbella qitaiheensis]